MKVEIYDRGTKKTYRTRNKGELLRFVRDAEIEHYAAIFSTAKNTNADLVRSLKGMNYAVFTD